MLHFDPTIRLGDVVTVLLLFVGLFKVFLYQRDLILKILAMLGSKSPPDGILGDVEELKKDAESIKKDVYTHDKVLFHLMGGKSSGP
jgi:hypothetical protein